LVFGWTEEIRIDLQGWGMGWISIGWYENGQKRYEGTIKDGKEIDKKCWDEDGNERECN
jgi:hypothetical protein